MSGTSKSVLALRREMLVNRFVPNIGVGKKIVKVILDFINWTSYSSLQKWVIVSLAALTASWQFSLWTLLPLYIAVSFAGIKLSEQIIHHKKASHVAEFLFYKLESAYIEIRAHVRYINAVLSGNSHSNDSELPDNIITELCSVYEVDGDKSSEGNAPVKLTTAMKLEINSIQLLIIRDFVRSWYADFSYDPQFLKETKYYLQQAFNNIIIHIARQNPQLLLIKVIKLYHVHFTMYQRARNSFESHKIHPQTKMRQDPRFKRHSSVDDAFESTLNIHPALESETCELNYLKGVVSIIVLSICSFNVLEGPCVKTLLIQILTNNVMLPVMKMMSNPDWLMEVIIILTSDENIKDDITAANVINSSENVDENKEVVENKDDTCILPNPGDSDSGPSSEFLDCLENDILPNSSLQLPFVQTQTEIISQEPDKTVCNNGNNLISENHHDLHISYSHSFGHETEDLKLHQLEMPQSLSADSLIHEQVTSGSSHIITAANGLKEDVNKKSDIPDIAASEQQSSYKYQNEFLNSHTEDDEESSVESKNYTLSDDVFESDPQKIESYGHRQSQTSVSSDTCSISEHSVEENSSETDSASGSFSKLSSIKNFFVDSLKPSGKQQFIKKPKSLSLFSEKLTSNLNPLSHKKSVKGKQNGQQDPPQLLVDGVPVEKKSSVEDPHIFAAVTSSNDQPTPTYADVVMTPSPGFFSSMNSFFSLSSSQNDMKKLCEDDELKMSPLPTPSPTGQIEFGIEAVAVIKDSNDLKPCDTDDRRIFQDVTIPQTSTSNEFRSTTQYSLYNIEYEALYFTEEGKSVLRSGKVRRRYREFLSLQSRLETHQGYRKYLKSMKVPKRWPSIPFKSLDRDTVEARRIFLEKYLKDLIEIEAICNGPDLREFLAYEGDSHIAFVNKSPDITVPRFDKMLMRGVSGVVDKIKALPTISQEVMSGLRGRETPEEKQGRGRNHFDADAIDVNTAYLMDMISDSNNILHVSSLQVLQDLDTEDEKDLIHSVITDPRNVEQMNEAYKQEVEKVLASLPRIHCDDKEASHVKDTTEHMDLSVAVLDLLIQGLQERDHWMCRERVVKSMHAVLGKALTRYLENAISLLTTEPQLVNYLKLLRETIWPQGQLWSGTSLPKTEEQRAAIREKAKRSLVNYFPASLRLVVGDTDFEEMIGDFICSIQSEKMNRHILYVILDMLIEQLFPEITSHDLLHRLLFSKSMSSMPS